MTPGGEAGTWAIVAAGGEGRRLGADMPKAFVPYRGRPLLAAAIDLFEDHPAVDGVVLVVPAGWEEPAALLADELAAGKVNCAVAGGDSRAASVAAGLDQVPAQAGVVLVHDAARPLATPELVSRVLAALTDADGAVPGLPMTDTVKRVAGGTVAETLERGSLVAVQTPQAFRAEAIRQAYAVDAATRDASTDCAALVEAAGLRVAVVDGDPDNLKVTVAGDIALAERTAAAR
ncbi:MAG TPA: 2-C-methyl-D-erythritol 4-phosphate cytidylyltransferase [Thermoleophilia bacterium]|nr:2-C-methyl-D-erythritol 4-phosphate cytidylyltransferase [Thermoleophilia bacterium]